MTPETQDAEKIRFVAQTCVDAGADENGPTPEWFRAGFLADTVAPMLRAYADLLSSTPTRAATDALNEEDAHNIAALLTICRDLKTRLVPFGASAEGWDSAIATLARLFSSPSSTTATPGWNAEGECVECGVPFCKHWPERPSSRALSEEERKRTGLMDIEARTVAEARAWLAGHFGVPVPRLDHLLRIIDRLTGSPNANS